MLALMREQLAAIIAHARAEAPNECCGLLVGRGDVVAQVWPMTNADHSPTSFRIDPLDLLRGFEAMDTAGADLVAIYHSHPHSPAQMSETDLKYAPGYPDARHVIVSLASPLEPEVCAYRVSAGVACAEEVLLR